MLDTTKILNTISNQFAEIINSDLDYYNKIKLVVEEERMFFMGDGDLKENTIYITVSFLQAEVVFGQTSIPVVVECLTELNNIDIARKLLYSFSEKYNYVWDAAHTVEQAWSTPTLESDFDELFEGFASTASMAGAFLITSNGNRCEAEYSPFLVLDCAEYVPSQGTRKDVPFDVEQFRAKMKEYKILVDKNYKNYTFEYENDGWVIKNASGSYIQYKDESTNIMKNIKFYNIYDFGVTLNNLYSIGDKIVFSLKEDYKKINALAITTATTIALDSQAFFNKKNFTTSVAKFGSFSINITTYLFDDDFLNKCLSVYLGIVNSEEDGTNSGLEQPNGIDTKFDFRLTFKSGHVLKKSMKLQSLTLQQPEGELPTVSLTFAE